MGGAGKPYEALYSPILALGLKFALYRPHIGPMLALYWPYIFGLYWHYILVENPEDTLSFWKAIPHDQEETQDDPPRNRKGAGC